MYGSNPGRAGRAVRPAATNSGTSVWTPAASPAAPKGHPHIRTSHGVDHTTQRALAVKHAAALPHLYQSLARTLELIFYPRPGSSWATTTKLHRQSARTSYPAPPDRRIDLWALERRFNASPDPVIRCDVLREWPDASLP
jgi:hypothetical protein